MDSALHGFPCTGLLATVKADVVSCNVAVGPSQDLKAFTAMLQSHCHLPPLSRLPDYDYSLPGWQLPNIKAYPNCDCYYFTHNCTNHASTKTSNQQPKLAGVRMH